MIVDRLHHRRAVHARSVRRGTLRAGRASAKLGIVIVVVVVIIIVIATAHAAVVRTRRAGQQRRRIRAKVQRIGLAFKVRRFPGGGVGDSGGSGRATASGRRQIANGGCFEQLVHLVLEFLIDGPRLFDKDAQCDELCDHLVGDQRAAIDLDQQQAAEVDAVLQQQVRLYLEEGNALGGGQLAARRDMATNDALLC